MGDDKAKRKLKEWIDGLSPETIKNLEITLSTAIPVVEIYKSNSSIPLSAFGFSQKGISEEFALRLLENIGGAKTWTLVGGRRITISLDGFALLRYAQLIINKKTGTKITKPGENITTSIKDARLDEQNYLLEINNGEKIISFKSKKQGEGLEKETKQFKILYQLWEFRWEFKN